MARPSKNNPNGEQISPKRNDKVISKLEDAFKMGCSNIEACLHAEISQRTLYRWIEEDEELKHRFEELKETVILKARKTIFDNIQDPQTARWLLERKKKDEFSTKIEQSIEGAVPVTELPVEEV